MSPNESKPEDNNNENYYISKYDSAIGLFWAISLFFTIAAALIVKLIFSALSFWIIAVIAVLMFLILGLTAQAIITLARKD